ERFEQLQPEYMPRHPVYDGYTYLITYKNVSVKTHDPFENAVPSGLGVVIRLLRKVMHSVESSGKSCDNLFLQPQPHILPDPVFTFPVLVKSAVVQNGKELNQVVLETVSSKPLPKEKFSLPAGYTKVKISPPKL
ncbi:MAG: hypothetical protein ACK4GE_01840, partial [Caldimicrobium sp.]